MITTEAKLRILFRLVRAAAEFIPGAQIVKIVAETVVDVADEVRRGVVYTVEKPIVQQPSVNPAPDESSPDLSLSLIWRELRFDHISFPPSEFKALLASSS